MKIAIINDTHAGARGDDPRFNEYFFGPLRRNADNIYNTIINSFYPFFWQWIKIPHGSANDFSVSKQIGVVFKNFTTQIGGDMNYYFRIF